MPDIDEAYRQRIHELERENARLMEERQTWEGLARDMKKKRDFFIDLYEGVADLGDGRESFLQKILRGAFALFEEVKANGDKDASALFGWWCGEHDLVERLIQVLRDQVDPAQRNEPIDLTAIESDMHTITKRTRRHRPSGRKPWSTAQQCQAKGCTRRTKNEGGYCFQHSDMAPPSVGDQIEG